MKEEEDRESSAHVAGPARPYGRRNYHLHSVIMFVHNVCTHVKSII